MCITFKSEGIWTIKEDCSKSNSKEKEVQSFVLCVDQPIDCQQEEEERSYRRFVQVVIGIIILASSSFGFFGKKGVFTLAFVLRVYVKIQHTGTNTCLQFGYKILSRVVLKDCN